MAEERVIISVELDKQRAQQEAQQLEKDLLNLRTRQRELNKAVKEGEITQEDYAREIVAVKTQIKQKSAEQRQAVKVTQAEDNSLNALKARLAQVTKERNSTNQATAQGVKRAQELDAEILDLNNRLKANEEASGQFFRNVGNYTNSIIEAADATNVFGVNVGQARGAVVAATSGIKGTNVALKAFKVALVSTGIGAIIVALGSFVSLLTNTQRGADRLNKVLATVGSTIDVITDRFSLFGEGLLNLFQGDFAAAVTSFRAATTGVLDEIITEGQQALALEERSQQLERRKIEFITEEARLRLQIEKLRTAGEDRSRSAVARERSLSEALRLTNQLTQERLNIQRAEVAILEEKQALGENLIEDDRQLAEQKRELLEIESASQEQVRTITNQLNATRLEVSKSTDDAIREYRINTEVETLNQIGQINDSFYSNPAASAPVRSAQEVARLRIMAAEKEVQAKQQLANLEKQVALQADSTKAESAASVAGQIGELANEQTAVSKAAGIAQATASTYVAANKALAAFPPPFSFIAAGATVAKGLLNVGNIAGLAKGGYVTGPGTSTSDSIPVMLSKGEAVINARSTAMFAKELSAINQAGGGRPFSVPNAGNGYAQGGIIQANRNISAQLDQRSLIRALRSMPAPVVSVEEFSRVQNRVQVKQNQTNV